MKNATFYINDGRCISEKYDPNETILEFKKRIKNKLDIPTYFQKLFLGDGKTELLDGKTFYDYNCYRNNLALSLINLKNFILLFISKLKNLSIF